jgi:hypothetical protein
MFVEINTGTYIVISLILFITHFGNSLMSQNYSQMTILSACCWCMISLLTISFIYGGSQMLDSPMGAMASEEALPIYAVCFITLLSSSCMVSCST